MKKLIIILIIIILILSFLTKNNKNNTGINILDLKEVIVDVEDIKYICSYDFCDYLRSKNINKSIEIFINRYLKTIDNEELKNTLKTKGIIITKIVYNN